MRVVIIGGSGHIGSYLTPRLIEDGHSVLCVSRRLRQPYVTHAAWAKVEHVVLDRAVMEAEGQFGSKIRRLEPDCVIDLTAYTRESTQHLVEALRGRVQQFLHCGTIWVHGPSASVPTSETAPRRPFGSYGVQKAAIEAYLIERARQSNFPATLIHPGHIVGRDGAAQPGRAFRSAGV